MSSVKKNVKMKTLMLKFPPKIMSLWLRLRVDFTLDEQTLILVRNCW